MEEVISNTNQTARKSRSFLLFLISAFVIFSVFLFPIVCYFLKINPRWVMAILPVMLLLTGIISIVGFILGIIEKKAKPVFRWIGLVGNALIVLFWIILFCAAILVNITDILKVL